MPPCAMRERTWYRRSSIRPTSTSAGADSIRAILRLPSTALALVNHIVSSTCGGTTPCTPRRGRASPPDAPCTPRRGGGFAPHIPNAVELVVCGGREGRAQARRGARAAGRAVIVRDFGFRGNKAANKLRNYHDHGPDRDDARTNRTERARAGPSRRRGGCIS